MRGRSAPDSPLIYRQDLIARGTKSTYYTNQTSCKQITLLRPPVPVKGDRITDKRGSCPSGIVFWVDGTKIPDVDFDIGESYAGLLPISSQLEESRQFYFWFFPSENPAAKDKILIWLNGGPGCSSLEGLLQENGPFIWQYSTLKPVPNLWTWVDLTNVVWIDQPIGTGFSQGENSITTEAEMASQFLVFLVRP